MANLQIRINDSLKEQATSVLKEMGLDLSSAIRMFLAQVVTENGFPFKPTNESANSTKNRETLRDSGTQIQEGPIATTLSGESQMMERPTPLHQDERRGHGQTWESLRIDNASTKACKPLNESQTIESSSSPHQEEKRGHGQTWKELHINNE